MLSCHWGHLGFQNHLGPQNQEANGYNHPILMFWKKNISEQNDEISSEILPSFRTEALEDRDVIFNQIQAS